MKKLLFVLVTVYLLSLSLSNVLAVEQNMRLLVNTLKIFPVFDLKRVAVGDPNVADVTILSEREVMLIAKRAGMTSLIIWDESGQRSFQVTVIEKDLEKIAHKIRGLFASLNIFDVRVKIEEDNIYIIGELLSDFELITVKEILSPFANIVNLTKLRERMPLVEITVEVLEVAFDDEKKLGIQWSDSLTYTEPSGTRTPDSAYAPKDHVTGKFPKLWRVFKWDRSTVTAQLNFLIEEGKARTLANPKLVTLSGKEATFLVGGEVPYVTVTSGTAATTIGTTQVEWKEYGIVLKINPLVNAKNEIRTSIKAEVSDLDWANAVTFQGFNIPALKKREVQTELFLNEGDTVFLAGLIKSDDSRNVDRLPWLSTVPILGELFKSTEFKDERTELVISITPAIVGERADQDYIASEMLKQEAIMAAQQRFPAYSEAGSPLVAYTHLIEDIITRTVVYPEAIKEAGLEGIVRIDLHILANGELHQAKVKQSSGYAVLDKAVLAAVKELAPFPSLPEQITQKALKLTVPVVFKNFSAGENE